MQSQRRQVLLFVAQQVRTLAAQRSRSPALAGRLNAALEELASVVMAHRWGTKLVASLLEQYATPPAQQLPRLLALAQADQAVEERRQRIEQDLRAGQNKLDQIQAQIGERQAESDKRKARIQELEQDYLQRQKALWTDHQRLSENLKNTRAEEDASSRRANEASRQQRTDELRKLADEKSALQEEIRRLEKDKDNLERMRAQLSNSINQARSQPAVPTIPSAPASPAVRTQWGLAPSAPAGNSGFGAAPRAPVHGPLNINQLAERIYTLNELTTAGDLESLFEQLKKAAEKVERQFEEALAGQHGAQRQNALDHLFDLWQLTELHMQLIERGEAVAGKDQTLWPALNKYRSELQTLVNRAKEKVKKKLALPNN
jgi:hypothetical protein